MRAVIPAISVPDFVPFPKACIPMDIGAAASIEAIKVAQASKTAKNKIFLYFDEAEQPGKEIVGCLCEITAASIEPDAPQRSADGTNELDQAMNLKMKIVVTAIERSKGTLIEKEGFLLADTETIESKSLDDNKNGKTLLAMLRDTAIRAFMGKSQNEGFFSYLREIKDAESLISVVAVGSDIPAKAKQEILSEPDVAVQCEDLILQIMSEDSTKLAA